MKLSMLVPSAALASLVLGAGVAPVSAQTVPQMTTNSSQETITNAPARPATVKPVSTSPTGPTVPAAAPAAPAPPAEPEAQPRKSAPRFTFGPDLGLYLPTKNLVKDRFGDNWFSLGIGFGQYETAPMAGRIGFNLSFFTNKHNSNTAFLIPIGVQYRKGLTQGKSATPYVGAEGDLVISDIHSATDNVKWGVRTSAGASAFAGVDFGTSARLEVQYRGFTDIAGYDFSGTNLVAGFRF